MRKRWLLVAAMLMLLFSAACTARPGEHTTLTVLAAASLTESFSELGPQFEAAHPGVSVEFNFAGSQQLAQQLAQGAQADVFASANQKQMDVAVQSGRIAQEALHTFAQNRLVVIYPKSNPAGLSGLADLARPGLKIILADKDVPVGQYSLSFLGKASQDPQYGQGYQAAVLANVVSYETNVKAVLTKVSLGEADAGIVYSTDLTGGPAASVGRIDIPDALNVIAVYPIAVVQDSPNPGLAQAFVDMVLSPTGQAVLGKYGFLPAK